MISRQYVYTFRASRAKSSRCALDSARGYEMASPTNCVQVASAVLPWLSAIGPTVVALIAAVIAGTIAYRQWRTAHQQAETARKKLKFDLFTMRYEVYTACRDLLASVTTKGTPEREHLTVYFSKMKQARWLFDPNVFQFLDDILMRNAIQLIITGQQSHSASGAEKEQCEQRLREIRLRMSAAYDELDKWFAPYMTLEH